MGISKKITKAMQSSSWIRAMFEEGESLKKMYGAANILDFTLGNPVEEPPEEVKAGLVRLAKSEARGMHRYMSNSGYDDVREKIAAFHEQHSNLPFSKDHIIMTVGSAGAMNVVLKALLDEGDEVIVPNPFFVEFMFYIGNHGGVMRLAETTREFHLDMEAIDRAITKRTKAIIINSPHNPTGVVYGEDELKALASLLDERKKKGERIFLLADEAYRKIIYDNVVFPDMFKLYEDTITITSHSKDLGLPGERIGYIALSPQMKRSRPLIDAMIFANRILGFINAPALMQRLVGDFQKNSVDITGYQEKRDAIYSILVDAGFDVVKPMGAFYIFPKSPIDDDVEFIRALQKEHILGVPGVGFGRKGYFRLAYCVEMETILRSREIFLNIGAQYRGGKCVNTANR